MQEDQAIDEGGDAADAAGEHAAGTPVTEEDLRAALDTARGESTAHWERYLRTAAELENLRRRATKDVENAHKFGLERFAAALLAVMDSLEMGLAASEEKADAAVLREGMETTRKQLSQVFGQFGISQIDPAGEPFDSDQHEAIGVQETAEVAPDCILMVVQKGYLLNERLLRPARVIVARAAA